MTNILNEVGILVFDKLFFNRHGETPFCLIDIVS